MSVFLAVAGHMASGLMHFFRQRQVYIYNINLATSLIMLHFFQDLLPLLLRLLLLLLLLLLRRRLPRRVRLRAALLFS